MTGWPSRSPGTCRPNRSPERGKAGPVNLKKLASQAMGSRYQMVADGKQVFLVDLKNGRVWRYFHNTKEAGFSMEDEGFLPIGPVLRRPEALHRLGDRAAPRRPGEFPPNRRRRGSSRNEPGVAAGPGLGRVHPGGSLALGADAAVGAGAQVLAGRTGPAPVAGAGSAPGRTVPGSENRQPGPGLRPVSARPGPVY